ncbi:hypothetical protein HELRODRAFT_188090 [Helobdella robusta]|uniref:START domain-containing protein n=1 Tax=Helobdella robusta TaxID=6412 RepID=T1FPM1_HELRO|nr:hypothetical protein HELRODRAFT_188090 [Helobdella robusta]ESO13054.1 hypothetical protein HELRODRAFT_188090 [Helobdella robusta]
MISILLLLFTIIIITCIYFLFQRHNKVTINDATELLYLFERNKVLPIDPTNKWSLIEVRNTLRVWSRTLTPGRDYSLLKIQASFAILNDSLNVVCNIIRDSKTQKNWNSMIPMNSKIRVIPLQAIENFGNFQKRSNISIETSNFNKENVTLERKKYRSKDGIVGFAGNWINNFLLDVDVERSWLQQNENVFWLLEHPKNFEWWIFYLVTTIDDQKDKCILNVITNESYAKPTHLLAIIFGKSQMWINHPSDLIMGFRDFIENEKSTNSLAFSQFLNSISENQQINFATDAHGSLGKSDGNFPKRKNPDDLKNSDISFFQKLKNMIEEKKDEVEQTTAKLRRSFSNSDSSDLKGDGEISLNPIEIIKRISLTGILFDDKKNETEVHADLNDAMPIKKTTDGKKGWRDISDAISKIADEKKISKNAAHRTNKDQISEIDEADRDLIQCLDTMIDNAALDVIAENGKIANLNIKSSLDDQAIQSGGWVYCGLEKDTVILKKSSDLTIPLHSYISRGMISCPPKMIYELLISPTSRLTYDDAIKDVEVIKEFDCGIKIVRLLYEIGQNFKRELHEFVVLQGERMEGMKHIITLQSVDWDYLSSKASSANKTGDANFSTNASSCGVSYCGGGSENLNGSRKNSTSRSTETSDALKMKLPRQKQQLQQRQQNPKKQIIDDAIRAKMFSSGWIIEPVMKTDKLCSMVTYICQMQLGAGMRQGQTYMSEEVAVKQPLCIVHLRNYIAKTAAKDDASNKMTDNKRNNSVTLSLSNALARFKNGSVDRVDEEEEEEEEVEEEKDFGREVLV